MDRPRCGICNKKTLAYTPTHIDANGDALKENIIHDIDKFCKDCLIKNFEERKGCPAFQCGKPYLCPFDKKQLDAASVDAQGDTIMCDADTEYEDRIEGAADNIADINIDDLNLSENDNEEEDDEVADPNYVPSSVATVVEPVKNTEKVVEDTTPKARRTSPITAEERSKKSIKQLAAIEQEIGIPLEHCYYYILKESKKLPNKICVVARDKCKQAADGRWYCEEHAIYGPSEMQSRELNERKIQMKKLASAKKRLRDSDKSNQREMLDIIEKEQEEQAKEKVRKTFYDLFQKVLESAKGQQ